MQPAVRWVRLAAHDYRPRLSGKQSRKAKCLQVPQLTWRASEKGEKQLDENAVSMLIYIIQLEDAGIPYLIAETLVKPKN